MAGVRPGEASTWAGLARSPFLGDADARQKDPGRILLAVLGGGVAGLVADAAARILIAVLFTLATGRGGEGVAGLERLLRLAESGAATNLSLNLLALLIAAGGGVAFAASFVAFAALLAHRSLHGYVTVAPSIRWRLLAVGLLLSLLALGPVVVAERYLASDGAAPILAISPGWAGRIAYGASALLLIPVAAAEELVFRGWLLRQVSAFTRRPGLLVGLSAVLFSAAHLDFSLDGFVTRLLLGAGFAYMTLRLGGIELACAAHAANNLVIVLFLQPFSAPPTEADAGLTLGSLVFDAALAAGYVAVTESLARVARLRAWAGVGVGEISPA